LKGSFNGTINYVGNVTIHGVNGVGDVVIVRPFRAFNQMMAHFNLTKGLELCVYTWSPIRGSMVGLPISEPTRSTKDAVNIILSQVAQYVGRLLTEDGFHEVAASPSD
jgi:hypothetical protein